MEIRLNHSDNIAVQKVKDHYLILQLGPLPVAFIVDEDDMELLAEGFAAIVKAGE